MHLFTQRVYINELTCFMQRNGAAGSVAGLSPLMLAKHPTDGPSPPRINQAAAYAFALMFLKFRIWGKAFKEKMLLYFRAIECCCGTVCLCPAQAGHHPSISPLGSEHDAALNIPLPTVLLTLTPTTALARCHKVGMWPTCCPQPALQGAVSRRQATWVLPCLFLFFSYWML